MHHRIEKRYIFTHESVIIQEDYSILSKHENYIKHLIKGIFVQY